MDRKAKAVITRETGKPVVVEEITVSGPQRGEITIRLDACGVCHSDLSATNGTIAFPPPLVLGHEGAGTVVEVGEGVTDFALGDSVLSSYINMCGKCRYCSTGRPELCDMAGKTVFTLPDGSVRTHDAQGQPLNVFTGCGVMAEYATLNVGNAVKVDAKGVKPECCALISCGVMTGWGAVVNTAKVRPGSICVVFGTGGVGLNAVQGCAMSGASMIVAVDTNDAKLSIAKSFGATHTFNPASAEDPVKALKKLTAGGADYAFECVGHGTVLAQAFGCLRKGGMAVMVGVTKAGDMTSIRTNSFSMEEKVLTGSNLGGARPREDFPRLIGLYRAGRLKLDELITQRYSIDEAPQAFDDLASGRNARGVIVFNESK